MDQCEAARNLLQLPNIMNLPLLPGGTFPPLPPLLGASFQPLPRATFLGVMIPPLPSFSQTPLFPTTPSIPFLAPPPSTSSTSP
ncbi:hypothetical protein ACJRO7_030011 [Eucalyptus globulus]|uniref:Uncharacterized protein n=1 Tax=Eucalyptus globulus TaxID=34317 RepID=A0ABD3JD25_EUCGL